MSGCLRQDGPVALDCRVPQSLTIQGANLNSVSMLVNVSGLLCTPNRYWGDASDTLISCAIQQSNLPFSAGVPVNVTAIDTVSQLTSDPVPYVSFLPYTQVSISSVSGCTDMGNSTVGCDTDTSVLTLTGSGFTPDMGPVSGAWLVVWTSSLSRATYSVGYSNQALKYVDATTVTLDFSFQTFYFFPSTGVVSLSLQHGQLISNVVSVGFIATANNSRAVSWANRTSPITIKSVSGCAINVNSVTTFCARPPLNYFTITGSGFPVNTNVVGPLWVSINGELCSTSLGGTATSVLCTFSSTYAEWTPNVLLPVVVADLFAGVSSAPYYGVSFFPQRLPYVTSISGCQGSGQLTAQCNVLTDSLMLTGGDFSPQLRYTITPSDFFSVDFTGSVAQSSTSIVLPLTVFRASFELLQDVSASNRSVMLILRQGSYLTSPVYITVAPPVVNVSLISSSSCNSTSSPLQLANCIPGTSVLLLYGSYLVAPLTISVADAVCGDVLYFPLYVSCVLPAPGGFVPGVAYDVVVVQGEVGAGGAGGGGGGGGGSPTVVTLPGAVSFTARPTVLSVGGQWCPRDYAGPAQLFSTNCQTGDVLTVVGSFFSAQGTLAVQFSRSAAPAITKDCDNVTLLSQGALTCIMPQLDNVRRAQHTHTLTLTHTHTRTALTRACLLAQLCVHTRSAGACCAEHFTGTLRVPRSPLCCHSACLSPCPLPCCAVLCRAVMLCGVPLSGVQLRLARRSAADARGGERHVGVQLRAGRVLSVVDGAARAERHGLLGRGLCHSGRPGSARTGRGRLQHRQRAHYPRHALQPVVRAVAVGRRAVRRAVRVRHGHAVPVPAAHPAVRQRADLSTALHRAARAGCGPSRASARWRCRRGEQLAAGGGLL